MKEDWLLFRYLRWTTYQIFIRRSKRVKQLSFRMNQMIENSIKEYPGEQATLTEFDNSIRCMLNREMKRMTFFFSASSSSIL